MITKNNFFGNNENKMSMEINRENLYGMHIYGKEFYSSSKEEYGEIVFKDCDENRFKYIELQQEQIDKILNIIFDE